MIDFPTLFPSLVKYIPNWMEKFYPRMAQFARGEGYPCGNKGVFIPRRNKCWTHPKTGQRMRKPLTYQNYQDAKEKSQRSRTEKGRTALANREQSFRDNAREKAKGWQNKTPESEVALKVGTKQVNIVGSPELYKELNLTHDPSLGWQLTNKKGDVLRQPKDGQLQPTHRFKEKSQAENFAKQVIAKVDRMTGKPAEAKMRDTLKKAIAENELNKSLADTAYQKYHQHQNGMKREAGGLSSRSIASLYKIPHATAVARINGLREAVGLGSSNAVSVDKELGERINDLLNDGKQIKINSSGGSLRGQKKEPSQTTIGADKKWSDFLESKNVTEKGLRKLDPETRKKITEEFENIRIEERAQESSKRKGLSLPEEPKPTPNSTGAKGAGGKTFDLNDLWRQTADAAYSKNKDGVSKNLEQWKEVVKKLESGEGISKDVNLNEYEKLMDNLEKKLVLDPKDPSNVEFKKITGSIYRTLDKAVRRDRLTQEDLEKAHPNFRPIMQRMKKTFTKQNELSDKRQQSQKELDLLKHRQSYNESIVRSNSRQFREMGIDNNYNELRLLTKRNPNDMVEVRNPVSNLPERTVTLPERLNEINRDIRDLSDDKKAQISQDRAKEEIARLQKPIKDSEGRVSSLTSEIKALRESRGEPDSPKRKRAKKNDFNSNLKLAQFGGNNLRILKSKLANFAKPGCCCDASKPLKRRKTKQTPRLKRRGNKYA